MFAPLWTDAIILPKSTTGNRDCSIFFNIINISLEISFEDKIALQKVRFNKKIMLSEDRFPWYAGATLGRVYTNFSSWRRYLRRRWRRFRFHQVCHTLWTLAGTFWYYGNYILQYDVAYTTSYCNGMAWRDSSSVEPLDAFHTFRLRPTLISLIRLVHNQGFALANFPRNLRHQLLSFRIIRCQSRSCSEIVDWLPEMLVFTGDTCPFQQIQNTTANPEDKWRTIGKGTPATIECILVVKPPLLLPMDCGPFFSAHLLGRFTGQARK